MQTCPECVREPFRHAAKPDSEADTLVRPKLYQMWCQYFISQVGIHLSYESATTHPNTYQRVRLTSRNLLTWHCTLAAGQARSGWHGLCPLPCWHKLCCHLRSSVGQSTLMPLTFGQFCLTTFCVTWNLLAHVHVVMSLGSGSMAVSTIFAYTIIY